MKPGVRPRSPSANPLPCWPPQPEGPRPAKRRRLHGCTCPGTQAQPDLEAPTGPASEQLTTTMFLPACFALQLRLEDVDMLLQEAQPDSVMPVTLPGHSIVVVPEGLQDSAQRTQPGFWHTSQQEMPQDHRGALHQGSSSAFPPFTQGLGNSDEASQGGLGGLVRPTPWMNAPAGTVPGLLLPFTGVPSPLFPGQVPRPWGPSAPSGAERYAPSSTWSLKGSVLWPLPTSPLQPLPPSPPPPSHQAQDPQSPQKPGGPCCKARRRLF